MDDSAPDPLDEAIERVVFDIGTFRDLVESDEDAAEILRTRLLASEDEVARRLVAPPTEQPPARPLGELLVGAGELVFGAFLTIGGLFLIVPSVLGFSSRGDLARYLADLMLGLSSPGLSDPIVSAIGFGLALFLLLAALYTLGRASRSLERSGLVLPPT